jgi:hypothetical protein
MSQWGPEGPPLEAYSRVTNPERFRPLHSVALRLLERLEATFDVEHLEGYGLDPELEVGNLAHPTIKLVPRDPAAAPIVVVFTAFPSLNIRFGRWFTDRFPSCGCDACAETADDEAARLIDVVDDVTAGRFREVLHVPFVGAAWYKWKVWSTRGASSGNTRLERSDTHEMLRGSNQSSFAWRPWPRSKKALGPDAV